MATPVLILVGLAVPGRPAAPALRTEDLMFELRRTPQGLLTRWRTFAAEGEPEGQAVRWRRASGKVLRLS